MQLAIGAVMGYVGNGRRMRHDTRTLPGSSGSPCCNADLQLVGLHHAGDPKDWPGYRGTFNQAIPIPLIIGDLRANATIENSGIWDAPGGDSGWDARRKEHVENKHGHKLDIQNLANRLRSGEQKVLPPWSISESFGEEMKFVNWLIQRKEEQLASEDDPFKDAGPFRLGSYRTELEQDFSDVGQMVSAVSAEMVNPDAFYGEFDHDGTFILSHDKLTYKTAFPDGTANDTVQVDIVRETGRTRGGYHYSSLEY
jgi:hypothetical protein